MSNERRHVDTIGPYEIHEVTWYVWGDGNQREKFVKWEVISLTRGAVEFRTLQGAKNFCNALTLLNASKMNGPRANRHN